MSYIEIFLLAIGLCFDTLAVSMVGGSCMKNITTGHRTKICSSFAFVQGMFIVMGWALGSSFLQYISKFDHWIAFLLLLFIGGKMVLECFKEEEEAESIDLLNTRTLLLSSVATSIDALAVGISMAMLNFPLLKISITFAIVATVTAAAALLGLNGGKWLGRFLGKKSNLIGGLILIAIGVKILVEHLFFS